MMREVKQCQSAAKGGLIGDTVAHSATSLPGWVTERPVQPKDPRPASATELNATSPFLTIPEVARYLRVSTRTVGRMIVSVI